jgi:hypothetical protein
MSLPEMCLRVLESFPFQGTRFLLVTKVEQRGCQTTFGSKGTRMVRAGAPNTAIQDFAENYAGLLQMTLLEHDLSKRAEYIHAHRVLSPESGREVIEGLVQQTYSFVDITGAPE